MGSMATDYKMSQAPGEAAEFRSEFEKIILSLNLNYKRNNLARGIRYEYLREVLPGIFASHNVLCWKGTYYHGFCVTLHKEFPTPYLISPLVIGGRLDRNHGAKRAYFRDIEPNRKWPFGDANFNDSHNFRRGWQLIVEKCTRITEEKMLPVYLNRFLENRKPILHLLETLERSGSVPVEMNDSYSLPVVADYPCDYDFSTLLLAYKRSKAEANNFVAAIINSKPELFDKVLRMKSFSDLKRTLDGL